MRDIIKKFKENDALTESEEDALLQQLILGQKKNQLKKIRAEHLQKSEIQVQQPVMTVVKSNNYQRWAMAASVMLMVGAGLWFFTRNQTPQYMKLTEDYLAETPAYGSTKLSGAGVTIEENETQAKAAYAKADYEQAANTLFKIVESGKATPEHHYYLALSRMKQKQPDFQTAITHLLEARRISSSWKEFEVNWYLGIAYIRTQQFALARTELQKNIGNSRTKEVEKLLSELPK